MSYTQVAYHPTDPGFFYESWGIHMDRCTKSIVSNNEVSCDVTSFDWGWWDTGIRTDNCALTRLVCNTTENIHIGFLNGGSALSTYMFDDVMTGYHHRGLIQNWGLLGQQGSPTAPTDMQWVGTFQALHTQTINSPAYAEDFYVRANSLGTSYFPPNFIAVSSQNDPAYEIYPTPGTVSQSPYECPVDWHNVEQLQRVVLDSVVFEGPDSLKLIRLAKLEVYNAVVADSLLQSDAILAGFRTSFSTTDLGVLAEYHNKLTLDLPNTTAHGVARKLRSLNVGDDVAKHWRTTLILAYSAWADSDSTTVLSREDSTRLRDIALLCPYTEGPGVSLARTILFSPRKEYFSLYNDCEFPAFTPANNRIGLEPPAAGNVDPKRSVRITPNPSTGLLVVNAQGYGETRLGWTATDLSGKVVLSGALKQSTIDLSALDAGTYLLNFTADGQHELTEKIILTE